MSHFLRCPMRECRRSIDIDTLPAAPARPEPLPCLHYIAAWGAGRGTMVEETLDGLAGNRELVIRNLRPGEIPAASVAMQRGPLEDAARQFARVVAEPAEGREPEAWALFGDVHERDAVSRTMAQVILGPDPMVSRVAG